jgi:hypothetical protein
LRNTLYEAKDVANWSEPALSNGDLGYTGRPDLGIYSQVPEAAKAYAYDLAKSTVAEARRPYVARTAWAWLASFVEVKTKSSAGFNFDPRSPSDLLSRNSDADKARVQHATYAAEILLRQHRTHVFTIYISRRYVRLFRWDRAGIICTEPIDFDKEPEKLLNFVYRLAKLSSSSLGYGTSATLAKPDDISFFKAYQPLNGAEEALKQDILDNQVYYPIYKVCY